MVFDPFAGRGTVPLQAALMGRVPVWSDTNPMTEVAIRSRIRPPSFQDVATRLDDVMPFMTNSWRKGLNIDRDMLTFFARGTLEELMGFRDSWLVPGCPVDEWIQMVILSRLTGHSPGFFSVRTLPPNQAVSLESQRKLNVKHGINPEEKDLREIILKKTKSLLRDLTEDQRAVLGRLGRPLDFSEDWARGHDRGETLVSALEGQVRLVITSPPFLDTVHYALDHWVRNWFIGMQAPPARQGWEARFNTVPKWTDMILHCMATCYDLLTEDGTMVFEVGELRRGTVDLVTPAVECAEDIGFRVVKVMINTQKFTKTSRCWSVANNVGGTNTNRMLVLKKKK